MGSTLGIYTRPPQTAPLFQEKKRFVQVLAQAGKRLVDADFNDSQNIVYLQLRRLISNIAGDGAVGDAFKAKETLPTASVNNFRLLGGEDPGSGPEILFLAGHPTKLFEDEEYNTSDEISPRSTLLTECELTDSAAFYVPGELVGKFLIPDISTPSNYYEIISNTQNVISVSGTDEMIVDGAKKGDHYRITLDEPVFGDREDLVYLDVYLDEYDTVDDPDLKHTVLGGIEAFRRFKLIQNVFVREGKVLPDNYTWDGTTTVLVDAGPDELDIGDRIKKDSDTSNTYFEVTGILGTSITISNPTGAVIPTGTGSTSKAGRIPETYRNLDGKFIDADGNEHWMLPIARILREKANPFITDTMITDVRPDLLTLAELDSRYVNVTGDTMTGDLIFESGGEILGSLVLGHDQLKDESVGTRNFIHDEHLLGDGGVIPSSSNLPTVHDNRYYTKSSISLLFGDNLLVNPEFSKGISPGWDNNVPLPLWGGPAEDVLEDVQVHWMICGPKECCHGVRTQFQEDYTGCEVAVLCQPVNVCAGGLFVFQQKFEVLAEGLLPNDFIVKPFIDVLQFSSGLYQGKERYYFDRTINTPSGPEIVDDVFEANSGLRSLRTLFELPKATDSILVILGYETNIEKQEEPCCKLGQRVSVITCKTALRKFGTVGSIQSNNFQPSDDQDPEVINDGASATIASCESRKVPVINCVSETGLVTYEPGFKQKQLSVYKSEPVPSATAAFVWGRNTSESVCPELVETVCVESINSLKTAVGVEASTIECFGIDPFFNFIPESGTSTYTLSFTGANFPTGIGDLSIEEVPPIDDLILNIYNISVDPGGTSGTFDIDVSSDAPEGDIVIRFTDNITTDTHDCAIHLVPPESEEPCIYYMDEDCIPATNGITYPVKIIGKNFDPGGTSVTTDRVDVTIDTIVATATEVCFNYNTNISNPGTAAESTITVTTSGGYDEVPLRIVPVSEEFNSTNFEGSRAPTEDGTITPVPTQAYYSFENNVVPKLTILGTNLDQVSTISFINADIGLDRGSDSIVFSEQANGKTDINKTNFDVQNPGAIELNISSLIKPTEGKMPLAFRLITATETSKAYVPGARDQLSATSARFFVDNGGTGITIDTLFNTPGSFVEMTATLEGVGVRTMFLPVDTGSQNSVSVKTKVPVDTSQPVQCRVFCPPFGLNAAARTGFNLSLIGPGNDVHSVSNTVVASLEATAPVIASVTPSVIEQGQILGVVVKGVGFQAGATVSFSDVFVSQAGPTTVFNDGTCLSVSVKADGGAALGLRDLTVTNHPSLLSDTKPNAFEVVFPEAAIAVTQDLAVGNPLPSLRYELDSSIDGATVIESDPASPPPNLVGGFDITPFKANSGYIELEMQFDPLATGDFDMLFFLRDGVGQQTFATIGNTSAFPTGTFEIIQLDLNVDFSSSPIDFTDITGFGVSHINTSAGTHKIRWDNVKIVDPLSPITTIFDDHFGTPYLDTGSNHVVSMGLPLSRDLSPVVTKCDCVEDFSFYGDTGWELSDVVLMPYTEENIATPNQEWDGVDTEVSLSHLTYRPKQRPRRCCRNVFAETMYYTNSGCRAVHSEEREYDVEDPECGCIPPGGYTETIGSMISDPLLYRIIPDDGFNGTPDNYGESIQLKYCYKDPTDESCNEVTLGSKLTPDQVYFAGGGRNDPNINTGGIPTHPTTGNPIYAVVHLGPGSPQGSRENLIAGTETILAGSTDATLQMSPLGLQGLAVGMDVWIMNYRDPRNNGDLCLTACDILSNKDVPQIYGIYGTITVLDTGTAEVTVEWSTPTTVDATFQSAWGGRILASPADRLGFYWEASEGLIDFTEAGEPGVVVQWNFNLWAAHAADCSNGLYSGLKDCTEIDAGVLIADGDGETNKFKFVGSTGNVMIEREWFSLFSTPTREQLLQADGAIGSNIINVVDASRFSVCDMVEIVDDTYSPGFRTSVGSINLVGNQLILKDKIPDSLPGYESFDGFLTSRCAKVFKLVNRVNCQICPTEFSNDDGTPQPSLDGQQRVSVNFEAGTFTFDPLFKACVRIYSASSLKTYQLPEEDGIFLFRAINLWNAISEWSSLIAVTGDLNAIPDTTSIARDNSRPPTTDISFAGFKLVDVAPGTAGTDGVNLDQVNSLISGIGPETDPLSIHIDGSTSPTATIDFNNQFLTNLRAAVGPTDAVRLDQLPTNVSKVEVGSYAGDGAASKVIALSDATLVPEFILVVGNAGSDSFGTGGTMFFKFSSGPSMYIPGHSGGGGPAVDFDGSIISGVAAGTFTVGSAILFATPGPGPYGNGTGNTYRYMVLGN